MPGLKSPHQGLLPDEENRKCSIVKYCAQLLKIGNHSLKRKRTQGGLSDWRHSRCKWKLEQNIIAGVVIAGMVANALLCDRGMSYAVLPEFYSCSDQFVRQYLSLLMIVSCTIHSILASTTTCHTPGEYFLILCQSSISANRPCLQASFLIRSMGFDGTRCTGTVSW